MQLRKFIYRLEKILDDPRYNGFSADLDCLDVIPRLPERTSKTWEIKRIAPSWVPLRVDGRQVRRYNDYPCINLIQPAFSARAVDALRDLLEPNGELLPLVSHSGSYFAYNLTKVADVLDLKRSKIQWMEKPTTASFIERYTFSADLLNDLTIFRLPQRVSDIYVSEAFRQRAMMHELGGMNFQKVCPVSGSMNWLQLAAKAEAHERKRSLPSGQTLKGNAAIIQVPVTARGSNLSKADSRFINGLLDELDDLIVDVNSLDPAIGCVEGHQVSRAYVCDVFLSCPDANALILKLKPWLEKLRKTRNIAVMRKLGNFADCDAKESIVRF